MSTRFTLALGACIALTGAMLGAEARAQVIYFGGEGGWSNLEDQRDRFNVARAPNVKGRYDSGFAAGARGGLRKNTPTAKTISTASTWVGSTSAMRGAVATATRS